ncbi:MAG: cell wall hydrolase [Oscillospiraceae bacterium]|nr:cell wall hydrolase [Oscillospiraceae bacterium]
MNTFYKLLIALLVAVLCVKAVDVQTAVPAYSQMGSSGTEVEEIQRVLKERGLFTGEITGYYGAQTAQAVSEFQRQQGLPETGIADKRTLKRLGITIGSLPEATDANVGLLARIISAEGRGESYVGQVAIGAVICNRIEHPSFPDTLAGVIYQSGAFTALIDGQFNEEITDSAYSAARDALSGWDPSGGAIYYYNPDKTDNEFIHSRPVIKVIGNHRFCS